MKRLLAGLTLVLLPALSLAAKPAAKQLDLADTVANNRILTNFAKIVQASNLQTFLSSKGPFTFFVPTDSAFSKLPPGTLEQWLKPENQEELQRMVLFHLVNGKKYTVSDLGKLPQLLSCEGHPLHLKKSRIGSQLVLKAKIVHGDIRCLNGVIHEIDTVLVPPPPLPDPMLDAAATNPPPATNAPAASSSPGPDTNAPAANAPSAVVPAAP